MSVIDFDGRLIYIYNHDGTPWDGQQEAWFIPRQVAEVIGAKNPRKYSNDIIARNPQRFKGFSVDRKLQSTDGKRYLTTIINESGLYMFLMASNLPKAIDFQRKVSELLKKIRTKQITLVETMEQKPDIKLIEAEARSRNAKVREAKLLLHIADGYKGVVGLESRRVAVSRAFTLLTGEKLISPEKEKARHLNGHSENEYSKNNVYVLYPVKKLNESTLMNQSEEAIPLLAECIQLVNDELGIDINHFDSLDELYDKWLSIAHPDTIIGAMRKSTDSKHLHEAYFAYLSNELSKKVPVPQ